MSIWHGTYPRRWVTKTSVYKLWLYILLGLVPTLNFHFSARILLFVYTYVCIYVLHIGIRYAYTYTLIYINIYVVVSYSRIISLSSGYLKIYFLSSSSSSLMTLHGVFNLVAAEMWNKEASNLLLHILFWIWVSYLPSAIIPPELCGKSCQGVLTSINSSVGVSLLSNFTSQ